MRLDRAIPAFDVALKGHLACKMRLARKSSFWPQAAERLFDYCVPTI